MTRLGVLTLILLTGFMILVGVTRFLGKPSRVPTILKPSPGCAVGCWNGIHIGKTTMDEAESILQDSHFSLSIYSDWHVLRWAEIHGTNISGSIYPVYDNTGKWLDKADKIYLTVKGERLVSLGDAIQLWGRPIGTSIIFCFSRTNGYMTVYFKGDVQVRVDPSRQINNTILSPSALTPYTMLKLISYVPKEDLNIPRELQEWKGFVQFPPDYLISDYCG